MTVEEWLHRERENTKAVKSQCVSNAANKKAYYDGQLVMIDALLDRLPELGPEVTLRGLQDFCTGELIKAREQGSRFCLPGCPLMMENGYCMVCGIGPAGWDIDEIGKRMKEGKK